MSEEVFTNEEILTAGEVHSVIKLEPTWPWCIPYSNHLEVKTSFSGSYGKGNSSVRKRAIGDCIKLIFARREYYRRMGKKYCSENSEWLGGLAKARYDAKIGKAA